jgi:biopolymer transport protein ExbD/biopolymer transport protein TolR
MRVNSNNTVRAEINVTPLIDVLLVLLIVFMVIAPQQSHGIEAHIPQQATNQSETGNPVVLEIAGEGSYSLNSQFIAHSSLRERLVRIFEARGDRVLFVKAARTLDFQTVAEAIDAAHAAAIDRVGFLPRAN